MKFRIFKIIKIRQRVIDTLVADFMASSSVFQRLGRTCNDNNYDDNNTSNYDNPNSKRFIRG